MNFDETKSANMTSKGLYVHKCGMLYQAITFRTYTPVHTRYIHERCCSIIENVHFLIELFEV